MKSLPGLPLRSNIPDAGGHRHRTGINCIRENGASGQPAGLAVMKKPAWAFFNVYWFGAIAFQVADPVLICAFIDNEFHIHIKEGE